MSRTHSDPLNLSPKPCRDHLRTGLALLAIAGSFVSWGRAWPAGAATLAAPMPAGAAAGGSVIRLNGYEFDPLVGTPSFAPDLRYEGAPEEAASYYIVQFNDRITPAMRRDLEENQAVALHYVHENAFIVRADADAIDRVARLGSVRWIGLYEPAYKLSPKLAREHDDVLNRAQERRHGRLLRRIDTSSRITVHILTMERARVPEVSRAAESLGASGLARSDRGSGLVRAEVPRQALERLAREPGVLWVERELLAEVMNDIARWTVQSNDPTTLAAPVHQHGVTGAGQVVTVTDTGLDYEHNAFKDPAHPLPDPDHRKVTAYYTPAGASGDTADNGAPQHGTHVSGSVAGDDGILGQYDGDGVNSGNPGQEALESHDGQAFGAKLHLQDISNDPEGIGVIPSPDITSHYSAAASRGSWINTNSWGSSLELGDYGSYAMQTDQFVWDNPTFTVLFAAGNSGPSPGTISPLATAKDLISVGASANGSRASDLAFESGFGYFSSRGPTDDQRIKPDLMAPGEALWSAGGCDGDLPDEPEPPPPPPPDPGPCPGCGPPRIEATAVCQSTQFNTYKAVSGTSVAAPTAAGAAALVRQYYMGGWYPSGDPATGTPFTPSAALIKATLINSAVEMTGVEAYANGETRYPNNNQGWGRIHLDEALFFPGDARRLVVDDSSGLIPGQTNAYQFTVGSQAVPFEVTLVWTDPPRTAPTSPDRINDLDLVVTAPDGAIYRGNAYEGHNPGQSKPNATEAEADHLNNVESVLVLTPHTGTWTIQVGGQVNVVNASGRQPYALVMTGQQPTGGNDGPGPHRR